MTTWTTGSGASTAWTVPNADYRDRWVDWSTFTWGALQSSGITWGLMAGYTFANTTGAPSTIWAVT